MSQNRNNPNGRNTTGLILILIGGLLFIHATDLIFFPHWIFSWPMILIIIGVVALIKKGPSNGGWLPPMLIGVFFLFEQNFSFLNLRRFIAPVILVTIGLSFLFRSKNNNFSFGCDSEKKKSDKPNDLIDLPPSGFTVVPDPSDQTNVQEEYLDITSIMSGNQKVVYSKNFMGGEILTIMGGADIDLSNADIRQPIRLNITCFMGGAKIIVPPHWQVTSKATALIGAVEDKRSIKENITDEKKTLLIDGTCIMGGIEIRNFAY